MAANCDDHNNELGNFSQPYLIPHSMTDGSQMMFSGEFVAGNKMDSNNLATLFAPNILHPALPILSKEALSAQSCEERIDVINVIRCMIDRNKDLFLVSLVICCHIFIDMRHEKCNDFSGFFRAHG